MKNILKFTSLALCILYVCILAGNIGFAMAQSPTVTATPLVSSTPLATPTVTPTASPSTPRAAADYTLLEPLPCIGNTPGCSGGQIDKINIDGYIGYLFNLFISMAAAAAVFMIVWGGFTYITSDSISGKNDGIEKVRNAIWGLLLVLSSYIILKTINPKLVIIPPSLVPKLEIDEAKFTTNADFFNRLTSDINKYRAEKQGFDNTITSAQASVTQSEKKIDNMNAYLQDLYDGGYTDTDPEVKEILKSIEAEESSIRTQKANSIIAGAKSIVANSILAAATTEVNNIYNESAWYVTSQSKNQKINESIDKYISNIDSTIKARSDQLANIGAYDSQKVLSDYGEYSKNALELTRQEAAVTYETSNMKPGDPIVKAFDGSLVLVTDAKKKDLAKLDEISQNISRINDPQLRTELEARIKASRANIENRYKTTK